MAAESGLRSLHVFAEAIKLEHTVFALPFAMVGMVLGSLASRGSAWPGWSTFLLVLAAMVAARTAAMAYNRVVDRDVDAMNPRTSGRAIPAGKISLRRFKLYFALAILGFIGASAALGPLPLVLAPVALAVILGYSHAKRSTWLCHWILGLGLGIAPAAAFIAVSSGWDARVLWPVAAVTFWTAGFDILYSLQDEEFDKSANLHSAPQRFGGGGAIALSRASHVAAVGCLAGTAAAFGATAWGWSAVALVSVLLGYEQSLVRPDDLRRVNAAFFTVNGVVSILFFLLFLADFGSRTGL